MTGRYEVRDWPKGRLKVIVWCPPDSSPITMTTIDPARIPLLAEALNAWLAASQDG